MDAGGRATQETKPRSGAGCVKKELEMLRNDVLVAPVPPWTMRHKVILTLNSAFSFLFASPTWT